MSDRKNVRLIVAFALAPIAGVAACSAPFIADAQRDIHSGIAVVFAFVYGLPAGYGVSLVLGVPAFLMLRQRGRIRLWQSVLAGSLLGGISTGIWVPLAIPMPMPRPELLLIACLFGLFCGAVAGAVFWFIAIRSAPSPGAAGST